MYNKNPYFVRYLVMGSFCAALTMQTNAGPPPFIEEMGLSQDQQAQLSEFHDQLRDQRKAMLEQRREFEALIKSGRVDAAADLAAQNARERTYKIAERRAQLAEILTPEQIEKLEEVRANFGPPDFPPMLELHRSKLPRY